MLQSDWHKNFNKRLCILASFSKTPSPRSHTIRLYQTPKEKPTFVMWRQKPVAACGWVSNALQFDSEPTTKQQTIRFDALMAAGARTVVLWLTITRSITSFFLCFGATGCRYVQGNWIRFRWMLRVHLNLITIHGVTQLLENTTGFKCRLRHNYYFSPPRPDQL